MVRVVAFCALLAFWPVLRSWLAKRGIHYRSMKEQRELDQAVEREKQRQQ